MRPDLVEKEHQLFRVPLKCGCQWRGGLGTAQGPGSLPHHRGTAMAEHHTWELVATISPLLQAEGQASVEDHGHLVPG